jgi:putative chitinase
MRAKEFLFESQNSRAGLVPYFNDGKQIKYLFMIPSDPAYGGSKPNIAKGRVDTGESLVDTAVREAEEELGAISSSFVSAPFLGWSGKITGDDATYTLSVFAVEVSDTKLNKPHFETKSVHWLTKEQFLSKGRDSQKAIVTAIADKVESNLEEGWKSNVAAGLLAVGTASASLNPASSTQSTEPLIKPAVVASTQINKNLSQTEQNLARMAQKAGITGVELAAFLAQCAHETLDFTRMSEMGGYNTFARYDPKYAPKKAKKLGNKKAGDGAKYKGRGYIQLTGRENYRRAAKALNLPLETRPELVERPDIAAKVAIWYWNSRVKPRVTDFSNVADVTKFINAGLRGLDDREDKFKKYRALV